MRRLSFVVCLFYVAAQCSFAQKLSPEVREFVTVDAPTVALTHVRVVDGTGAPAREDQTVVLPEER